MSRIIDKLLKRGHKYEHKKSWLRNIVSGSFLKMSDLRGSTDIDDIKTKIDTMRALANDSQISTALSYYATDATTANTKGQIIWATSDNKECARIINGLFKRWNINLYVRDHILELATIGNFYMPTTWMYNDYSKSSIHMGVGLDNNTIPDDKYDMVPAYMIPPEDIIHIWHEGQPQGYIYQPEDGIQDYVSYPEDSVIHFSLGGLLGKYTIDTRNPDGTEDTYDIQFAEPLMSNAVSPTQTLSLLEDSLLLSSLNRIIKFINVDCQDAEEEEVQNILQQVKDTIEQQLSLNTATGDAQSFVNPQSPNNLIYLAQVNGKDAISITDLNMAEATEADNSLLDYYQNKKLSVLGVPKEAMNFSSAEGLGNAGTVMSQRSALYANILERLRNAYKEGWRIAINAYFRINGYSGYVDKFDLHMNPIITTQSTVQFEKRDAALNQATTLIELLKNIGIQDADNYRDSLVEILSEVFPQIGADIPGWDIHTDGADLGGGDGDVL